MQPETVNFSNTWPKQMATYVLAASIFSLSGALVYFAWKLAFISDQIPAILKSVEQTGTKIGPIADQVVEIKDLIPSVLHEVAETRKLVTPALNEIRLSREQIPAILKVTEKTNDTVLRAVEEIKATRPLIPEILNEVKQTREAIPPLLDRADKLVSNVRQAGKDASKGAVTGVFTGIVAAPFELIGNIGKRLFSLTDKQIKELTEDDLEMAKQSLVDLIPSENIKQTNDWKNPDTNASGKVTLIKIDTIDEELCKVFHLVIKKKNQMLVDKKTTVCQNENGEWEWAE